MRLPDSATLAARQARIRGQFSALDIDALVVTSFPNIRYLSNHVGSAGTATPLEVLQERSLGERSRRAQEAVARLGVLGL